jgi:hypothetical protein
MEGTVELKKLAFIPRAPVILAFPLLQGVPNTSKFAS